MNRKIIGRSLILLGVCMWVPFLVLEASGVEVSVMPFLAAHLSGVIPGAILLRGETLVRWIARMLNREKAVERDDRAANSQIDSKKKN